MCRLVETIKVKDGYAENIFWHNLRFNTTRSELFNMYEKSDLGNLIIVPEEYRKGEVKCRIGYGENIDFIEFETYSFRPVFSLQLVFNDHIQYDHKYRDRSHINELFAKRGKKDDILIVKNGLVSDSSYSNVVLSDGRELFTPAIPLLKGTKRAKYLFEGIIKERDIPAEDIRQYKEVHLINAFLDLGRCVISTMDL